VPNSHHEQLALTNKNRTSKYIQFLLILPVFFSSKDLRNYTYYEKKKENMEQEIFEPK